MDATDGCRHNLSAGTPTRIVAASPSAPSAIVLGGGELIGAETETDDRRDFLVAPRAHCWRTPALPGCHACPPHKTALLSRASQVQHNCARCQRDVDAVGSKGVYIADQLTPHATHASHTRLLCYRLAVNHSMIARAAREKQTLVAVKEFEQHTS
jgi:hypothetical protein